MTAVFFVIAVMHSRVLDVCKATTNDFPLYRLTQIPTIHHICCCKLTKIHAFSRQNSFFIMCIGTEWPPYICSLTLRQPKAKKGMIEGQGIKQEKRRQSKVTVERSRNRVKQRTAGKRKPFSNSRMKQAGVLLIQSVKVRRME